MREHIHSKNLATTTMRTVALLLTWVLAVHGAPADELVITSFKDVESAPNYKNIVVSNLDVPAGTTFALRNLQVGTTIVFNGTVNFGFAPWDGPLVEIQGNHLTVTGVAGHVLNGGGERWWDNFGGNAGIKKPQFFQARMNFSTIDGLKFKNPPVHTFSIDFCNNLTITKVVIDSKDGDYLHIGHNTDGFDLLNSHFIVIRDCVVKNQDDCFAMRSGSDVLFEHNHCSGGHGISIGSVGLRSNNDVARVTIRNNVVANSENGIRVKTVLNATGSVTNVTFENIVLIDIQKRAIVIQGNYLNLGPVGEPTGGVPINGLKIHNVRGNVLSTGIDYYVWVKNASNWDFKDLNITTSQCIGFPSGVNRLC